MACCGGLESASADRPSLEVADIFRAYGEVYRQTHALTSEQLRVMADIEICRTEVLGGHVDTCDRCGHKVPSYNSCLNRHCPKCQGQKQAKWIEQRKERTLPTHYFHIVFTLPEELRNVALCNRKVVFNMLFKTSSEALLTLGEAKKHLGGLLGITVVLHTWTRELDFHPHVHCIVTGGGFDEENGKWISSNKNFLFPIHVLSKLFRGKFLAAFDNAYKNGELEFAGTSAHLANQDNYSKLKNKLYQKNWVVYAKPPFGGPNKVFEYLGMYTHRVAISNYRLIAINDSGVTFKTRKSHSITLKPQEFIRRFLMHILPKNFVKIRHYGLKSSSNAKTKLEQARKSIEEQIPETKISHSTNEDSFPQPMPPTFSDDINATFCPHCKVGKMIRTRIHKGGIIRRSISTRNTS